MNPEHVIAHPHVTEKTMAAMEQENKLEFIVNREANKHQIKAALKELFDAEVLSVNTRFTMDGKKHAVVRFKETTSAEDIGMRIGVF